MQLWIYSRFEITTYAYSVIIFYNRYDGRGPLTVRYTLDDTCFLKSSQFGVDSVLKSIRNWSALHELRLGTFLEAQLCSYILHLP